MEEIPTVDELVTDCVNDIRMSRAPSTTKNYHEGIKVFLEYLGENNIYPPTLANVITMKHFTRFVGWLVAHKVWKGKHKEILARSTVKTYLSGVQYLKDYMTINDLLSPSLKEELIHKKAVNNLYRRKDETLLRTPGKGDAEKIIEYIRRSQKDSPERERDIALVEFLYSSGCRANEAAQLKISDIDLNERRAVVMGKGSKERAAYFSISSAEAFKTYWEARGDAGAETPAFARHDRGAGKRKTLQRITTRWIQYIIEDAAVAVGIQAGKFTPHYFRHAFGIRVLRETGNLALTQDLMGHASSDSTRIYAKIYPDELRDAHRHIFDK